MVLYGFARMAVDQYIQSLPSSGRTPSDCIFLNLLYKIPVHAVLVILWWLVVAIMPMEIIQDIYVDLMERKYR